MDRGQMGTAILVVFAAIVIIAVFAGIFLMGSYNVLVTKEEGVNNQWGNVETAYQRRFDLIPSLVNTVKGYATHEKGIWDEFAAARQAYSNAGSTQAKVDAANGLESVLAKLMVVVEAYPDLKANQNFLDLQAELAGTENRISVERMRYNQAVQTYTVSKRSFPTNIVAGMFGFKDYPYFEATQAAATAPVVNFTV